MLLLLLATVSHDGHTENNCFRLFEITLKRPIFNMADNGNIVKLKRMRVVKKRNAAKLH